MSLVSILKKYNLYDNKEPWANRYRELSKRERAKFLKEIETELDLAIKLREASKEKNLVNNNFQEIDGVSYHDISVEVENIQRILRLIQDQDDIFAELSTGDEEVTKVVPDDIIRNPIAYVGRKIKTPDGKIKPVKMVRFFEVGKDGKKKNVSGWYHFDTILMPIEKAYEKLNEALLINRHNAPDDEKDAVTEKYEELISELGSVADQYEKIGFEYDKNGEISIKGARENDIGIKLSKVSKK